MRPRHQHPRHRGRSRQEPPAREYNDDDGYSAYDRGGRTPFSEYDETTNGRRTVYSEYTGEYTEDRSSYSEYENRKRTPYSESITEYTGESSYDKMSATLGIARNQYCTTLNVLVDGDESSSSESSYSQSTYDSDFGRVCDAHVNTNCMGALFNRNSELSGKMHGGQEGEHSAKKQQKMTLPLPLHFMDHLMPSKQELNSTIDNFAQTFEAGEDRPGVSQVYKSLFEADLSQTISKEEDEEHAVDFSSRRKSSDRYRSHGVGFSAAKRDAIPTTAQDRDQTLFSLPSHIVIRDDLATVSSAESFGFAPETQKLSNGVERKKDMKRERNNHRSSTQQSSPRHSSPRHSSPRHTKYRRSSPQHSPPKYSSPRHSSPRRSPRHRVNGNQKEHTNLKSDVPAATRHGSSPRHSPRHRVNGNQKEHTNLKSVIPAATRHGLDRLIGKQTSSMTRHGNGAGAEIAEFEGKAGVKLPPSSGKVPSHGKVEAFSFRHVDEERQDVNISDLRKSKVLREGEITKVKISPLPQRKRSDTDGIVDEEPPSFDERLAPKRVPATEVTNSKIGKFKSERNAACPQENRSFLMKNGYEGMPGGLDANGSSWRNSANSIPPVLSLKPTQTGVSELTGEIGDFKEAKRYSIPLETVVASPRDNIWHATNMDRPKKQLQDSYLKPTNSQYEKSKGGEIEHVHTPQKYMKDSKKDRANVPHSYESMHVESSHDSYVVARRDTPNKKAETLQRLEDALMGSRKSTISDYKEKKEGPIDVQVFTFSESRFEATPMVDNLEIVKCSKSGKQLEMSIDEDDELMKKTSRTKAIDLEEIKLKMCSEQVSTTDVPHITRKAEQLGANVHAAALGGVNVERNDDGCEKAGKATNTALPLYPESFADYCKDVPGNDNAVDAVQVDRDQGNEIQNLKNNDDSSLTALENEIHLLESQITGLEQKDQSSEDDNHRFGPPVLPSEQVLTEKKFDVQITGLEQKYQSSEDDNHHFGPPVLPSEQVLTEKKFDVTHLLYSPVSPPQELPQIKTKANRKITGGNQHSKPPRIPSGHVAAPTEATVKISKSLDSKLPSKSQQKSTDATLVTAPTMVTMDTPFTMETPLVVSPAVKETKQRNWDRNSSMFVVTTITLPSQRTTGDQVEEIASSIFLVLIVGTKKYFSDLLYIAISWLRHITSVDSFFQKQKDRIQVGLMVPPIVEDDVLQEQQLQIGSLVVHEIPSARSEEPGIVMESFVPEMWPGNKPSGKRKKYAISTFENNSIWNKLFHK